MFLLSTLNIFFTFSCVSIVDIEQVNVNYELMLLPLLSLSSGQSQKIVFNGLRVTKTFCTRDAEEGIFFYIL